VAKRYSARESECWIGRERGLRLGPTFRPQAGSKWPVAGSAAIFAIKMSESLWRDGLVEPEPVAVAGFSSLMKS
jgi:hypothetical protein